eukprot:2005239-Alexandrium_andersonii.AAC.1
MRRSRAPRSDHEFEIAGRPHQFQRCSLNQYRTLQEQSQIDKEFHEGLANLRSLSCGRFGPTSASSSRAPTAASSSNQLRGRDGAVINLD